MKLALESALPALEAEDEIRRGKVADDRVYDVVLAATGSEELASRAHAERIMLRLKQHRPGEE